MAQPTNWPPLFHTDPARKACHCRRSSSPAAIGPQRIARTAHTKACLPQPGPHEQSWDQAFSHADVAFVVEVRSMSPSHYW